MPVCRLSIRAASALTLLLIFASAFGVKALHTHSDSRYTAIGCSSDAQSNSALDDDCPICRFAFLPYIVSHTETCTVFLTAQTFAADAAAVRVRPAPIHRSALRAPPTVG